MKTIQSIDKAMIVLEFIAQHNGKNSLTDMSIALDMKITTLHGILATLEHWHLIEKNKENSRYALGSKLFQLGKIFEGSLSIQNLLHPYLEALAAEFGETVHLAIPSNHLLLYIDRVESIHPLRMTSMVGTTEKLTATGLGLVLLSYMPEKEWSIIAREDGADVVALEAQLKKIRQDGYLIHNKSSCDSYCLSICIPDLYHTPLGINMVIPAYRFTDELAKKGITALKALQNQIQKKLK